MDKEMKNGMRELSMDEMEKVPGGIYKKTDVGRCKHCQCKTNGKWDEELQQFVCHNCGKPLETASLGMVVQSVF